MLAAGAFVVERTEFSPRCHSGRGALMRIRMFSVLLRRTSWGEHTAEDMQQDFWIPALRLTQVLQSCTDASPLIFVTESMCCAHRGRQSQACAGEQGLWGHAPPFLNSQFTDKTLRFIQNNNHESIKWPHKWLSLAAMLSYVLWASAGPWSDANVVVSSLLQMLEINRPAWIRRFVSVLNVHAWIRHL